MDEKCGSSFNNISKKQKSDFSKHCCFGCLCDNKEENVQKYSFQSGPLREIFQMDCILLCHLCKKMAQRTEMFIQNVQSNHILLENFESVLDETLSTVRSQTQPLVNLSQITYSIEISENSPSSDEGFSVVYSSNIRKQFQVKVEMKEEELFDDLEGEFVGNDEFSESCVKEEDEFPLKALLKEELELGDIDSLDLMTLSATLKKNKLKKKHKIKDEDAVANGAPKVKIVYLTKQQCLDERARLAQDPKYLGCAFRCENCIKGFSFKGIYDKHMERHSEFMGDHECDVCKQRMDSEEKLMGHMRYHLVRYKCPECGLVRSCRGTILDHYMVHHCQGLNHKCPHCTKTFPRRGSLRRHVSAAHGAGGAGEAGGARARVLCAHCHKRYASSDVLRQHMLL
ncbi:zinc finger protein 354B-like, partial [Trichoplusia ni]